MFDRSGLLTEPGAQMKYLQVIILMPVTVVLIANSEAHAVAPATRDCENHLVLGEVAYSYVGLLELYCRKVS